MAGVPPQQSVGGGIREIYEEYEVESGRVAKISDPENQHAWVQSDYTMPIEA